MTETPTIEIHTLYDAPTIHLHRDIRKQTIQDAEQFINAKRLKRMVTVQKHKQIVADKADKNITRDLKKWERKVQLFENAMRTLNDNINRAEKYLAEMQNLDHQLSNEEDKLL